MPLALNSDDSGTHTHQCPENPCPTGGGFVPAFCAFLSWTLPECVAPPQVLSEEGKLLSDLYLNLTLVHPHALLFRVGDSFALIVNSSDFEHLGYFACGRFILS